VGRGAYTKPEGGAAVALGAAYDVVKRDAAFADGDVVLVDAALPATDAQRAGWGAALAQGARVIISGARPATRTLAACRSRSVRHRGVASCCRANPVHSRKSCRAR